MLTQNEMQQEQTVFDPKELGGSIKRRIVNPDLVEEREKCDFDRNEAYTTLFSEQSREAFDLVATMVRKHPEVMVPGLDLYEMSRVDKFKAWWERLRVVREDPEIAHALTNASNQRNFMCTPWFF